MTDVYILIVNWNNWKDTLICLESIFRNDYPDFKVIVCDNGSEDNSLSYIKSWSAGQHETSLPSDFHLQKYISTPISKPIKTREYDRALAESGGDIADNESRLVLIQTGKNLGFAGGNNVGLRYALSRSDFNYIWLLNNDTVIKPDALTHLVEKMKERPDAGICGSTLLYYHKPGIVQAYGGGTYNKWLGYSKHIGAFNNIDKPINSKLIESTMDYVVGASMLISRKFLKDVGMISEEYFLFFEDIDWAVRGKNHFRLAYAPGSIVYHKEGESTGSGSNPKYKSLLADYYSIRARLLLTRKFFAFALPTVYLGLLVTIFNRIIRRKYARIGMIIRLLLNPDADLVRKSTL
jgi:GT2 family glycosyltransferase